jgi:hypothetical protein
MIELTRRGAMGWGFAAAASGLAGSSAGAAGSPFFKRTGLPIGLQLYTLGGTLKDELDAQLGQVAKIGYRTVEMAGYLGRTPKELRAAFDKAGLKAPIPAWKISTGWWPTRTSSASSTSCCRCSGFRPMWT